MSNFSMIMPKRDFRYKPGDIQPSKMEKLQDDGKEYENWTPQSGVFKLSDEEKPKYEDSSKDSSYMKNHPDKCEDYNEGSDEDPECD